MKTPKSSSGNKKQIYGSQFTVCCCYFAFSAAELGTAKTTTKKTPSCNTCCTSESFNEVFLLWKYRICHVEIHFGKAFVNTENEVHMKNDPELYYSNVTIKVNPSYELKSNWYRGDASNSPMQKLTSPTGGLSQRAQDHSPFTIFLFRRSKACYFSQE